MPQLLILAGTIATLCISQIGCTSAPIQNANFPITPAGGTSLDAVERSIIEVGVDLGWVIEPTGPGEATGTLNLRTHMAVVRIRYDARRVRIDYVDSRNLDHHGDRIHRNYNNWIRNLEVKIQRSIGGTESS